MMKHARPAQAQAQATAQTPVPQLLRLLQLVWVMMRQVQASRGNQW